jgi:hypothetical protein
MERESRTVLQQFLPKKAKKLRLEIAEHGAWSMEHGAFPQLDVSSNLFWKRRFGSSRYGSVVNKNNYGFCDFLKIAPSGYGPSLDVLKSSR